MESDGEHGFHVHQNSVDLTQEDATCTDAGGHFAYEVKLQNKASIRSPTISQEIFKLSVNLSKICIESAIRESWKFRIFWTI